jgi:AcrR family transcriptional regulator
VVATRTRTRLGIDERRAQLLDVGLELFSTRPYDEVRIDEVAARAGVSRGLLYHYFPTKRDFYVDVVRAAIADAYEFSEPDPSLPPLERLRASVDAWLDYVEPNAAGFLTTYRAGIGTDPEVRAIAEAGEARQAARIVDQVAGGADVPPTLEVAVRGWITLSVATVADWLEQRMLERELLRDFLVNALIGLITAAAQADPQLDRVLPPPPTV